jgi:hypothetical protein
MAGFLRDYGGSAAWKKWESWVERESMEVCESFGWIAARTNLVAKLSLELFGTTIFLYFGMKGVFYFFFYIFRNLKLFGFFPFKISTVRFNQWLRIWLHLLVFALYYFIKGELMRDCEGERWVEQKRMETPLPVRTSRDRWRVSAGGYGRKNQQRWSMRKEGKLCMRSSFCFFFISFFF